jgi:uncharacterized membrane protein YbhN (UPF0104 family)
VRIGVLPQHGHGERVASRAFGWKVTPTQLPNDNGRAMSAARSRLKVAVATGLRLAVTALVFAYLFSRIDARAVVDSLRRIHPLAIVISTAALVLGLVFAIVRWRVLLRAAGASRMPSWVECSRLYLVATFYNLLPGAVGGDVYRGYATRDLFQEGAVRSLAVVFIERVLGFAGLMVLTACATMFSSLADRQVLVYAALGLCVALLAVVMLVLGKRLGTRLPARLAKHASSLPDFARPRPLLLCLVLAVATQLSVALTGYSVLLTLAPHVAVADAMAIFPLGTLAAYFPLTVAGAGARDTALVVLLGHVGVQRSDALATSLSMLGVTLLVASVGAMIQLRRKAPRPVEVTP